MSQDLPQGEVAPRIPEHSSEGMPVIDRDAQPVGTVQVVYHGGATDEAIAKVLTSRALGSTEADERIWSSFDADGVPDEQRVHMMRNGYLRIEGAGIMGPQHYLAAEQIAGIVDGTTVQLRLSRQELLGLPGAPDAAAGKPAPSG
jgi:hypothetical protein